MDYNKKVIALLEKKEVSEEQFEKLQTIFPELKESEDERIRKRIIEWVNEIRKLNPTNADHNGDCSEAIAWLEKQGEQKPAEWSEEDENKRTPLDFASIGDIITYFRKGKKGIMLVSSFDYGKGDLQKSAPRCKWGISDIRGTAYGDWAPGYVSYYVSTEEEKKQLLDSAPDYVKTWYYSLKPQPHWKPSEEQMSALDVCCRGFADNGDGVLQSLYDQLKKL